MVFVSVRLSDVILDNELPIFAIYLETMTHEFVQCFGFFILLEIFLIKYWIEFVWKSMWQIDDNFIVNLLTIFNASLAIIFSCFMVVRGDEHINAKMVMNEFDWTKFFLQKKGNSKSKVTFIDVTFRYLNITMHYIFDNF